MLHPDLRPGASRIAGRGLLARRRIASGTVLWAPCPTCRIWGAEGLAALPPITVLQLDEYGYRLSSGALLLPCGGAHLFNHSCEAAVLDYGLDFGVAVRTIAAGEEATVDYRTFRDDPPWRLACHCGASSCCGRVEPDADPGDGVVEEWIRRLAAALPLVAARPQPLGPRLAGWSTCFRAARGGRKPPRWPRCCAASIRRPEVGARVRPGAGRAEDGPGDA